MREWTIQMLRRQMGDPRRAIPPKGVMTLNLDDAHMGAKDIDHAVARFTRAHPEGC